MTSKRELLQFVPVNIGADNLFSPDRNGLQQVVFQIPKLPRIMHGKTLRINGTFKVKDSDGNEPENSTKFFQTAAASDVFYIDGRIGVSSCIDNLSIQNLQGATYSNVKNYNRLCSSLVPLNQSFMNYINGVDDEGTYSGSGGTLAYSNGNSYIASINPNEFFFDGLIDDVRIYNHALSPAEIQELIPEPATLLLLTLGGILIRRKK